MHRCVCIWRYILQNYDYKLHFQNLSIYHIPHVSIRTWPLKFLMFALLVTQQIYVGFVADIDIKILGVGPPPPPGARHGFPRQRHMRREEVIFFCQGFLPCMMPSMDGWQEGWMHGWKASRKTTTTSFTICNPKRLWSFLFSPCQCRCWVTQALQGHPTVHAIPESHTEGQSEPAVSTHQRTRCWMPIMALTCGWISSDLVSGFTLVPHSVRSRS